MVLKNSITVKPPFEKNNVPIIFNFSKSYVPPFTVCLLSAMRYFSAENNYDIIILERALTDEQKSTIGSLIEGHDNISIRFFNPESFFKSMKYVMAERLPIEGFFRAAASFFMKEYDKVIYMDSDVLVKADLAELFNTDVEGFLIAAVQDLVAKAFLNMKKKNSYAAHFIYRANDVMHLKNPWEYFNSGVMILNCKQIRESFVWQDMLDYWKRVEFKSDDQDMFNSLFEGRVKFLDNAWNVFAKTNENFAAVFEEAPEKNYQEYLTARENPRVVHFITEIKPWCVGQGDFVMEFWNLARKSPYYEALLSYMCRFITDGVANYDMYQLKQRTLRGRIGRCVKKTANFFFPVGTKRHEWLKKIYFKMHGWEYFSPIEASERCKTMKPTDLSD